MDAQPGDRAEPRHIAPCPVQRLTRPTGILQAICLAILLAGSVCLVAKADIPISEYVRVYFEQDGDPMTSR